MNIFWLNQQYAYKEVRARNMITHVIYYLCHYLYHYIYTCTGCFTHIHTIGSHSQHTVMGPVNQRYESKQPIWNTAPPPRKIQANCKNGRIFLWKLKRFWMRITIRGVYRTGFAGWVYIFKSNQPIRVN